MNNWKIILIALATALTGLLAGYLIFGEKTTVPNHADHAPTATAGDQIWTCSMHPQIRQNEPGQCPICGMNLIPLDEASGSGNPLVMEMTPEAVKLANIETVAVGRTAGAASKTISLTGKIKADERLAASQVAHVPGRIEKLFVSFTGERIGKGQKLATIYSPELVGAQRELIEASKWKDSRPQLLEAARNKLRYWKISDTTISEIEKSGEVQPNITVFADQGGIVTDRKVSVGDYVKEGEVLFDIANLNRLWVLFDAYEEDLAEIRIGDEVSFTLPAAPGRTFKAKINFIDPVIDPQTRVASLRAEVSNSSGLLKPEMFVRGTVQAGIASGKGALTVPKTAVLWTGKRSVVYVEQPDAAIPSFEFREVTLGDAVGNEYLVLGGLEPGERVVVNGAFVIDAAAQLNNMASMMNRNVKLVSSTSGIPDFTDQAPGVFQNQLMTVVRRYLPLKDALVATDPEAAKAKATDLLAGLEKVDMTLLEGEAHLFWMEKLRALTAHGNSIAKSNDVEEQRKQFNFLTDALVETLTAFGTAGDTLYLQYCPMAFGDEGADWLSNEEAIRNPYFGDKMLKCGSVKQTFPMKREPVKVQNNPDQLHQH